MATVSEGDAKRADGPDLSVFEQRGFEVRFGWGPNGLRRLAPHVEAIVIIDVLSFSTSVDLILGRGGIVLPYEWHNGTDCLLYTSPSPRDRG